MNDILRLRGLRFHAHHGCTPLEMGAGQTFIVDVDLSADLADALRFDDLAKTINYDHIYEVVCAAVTKTRFNLLERLAAEICDRLLERFPGVQVRVVVKKPNPPVQWHVEAMEVEMVRGPRQPI